MCQPDGKIHSDPHSSFVESEKTKMRLRFTIRDLLWLAAVVALALGWWLDATRRERLAEQAVHAQAEKDRAEIEHWHDAAFNGLNGLRTVPPKNKSTIHVQVRPNPIWTGPNFSTVSPAEK